MSGVFHCDCIGFLSHFPNRMLLVSLEIGGVILSEPGGPGHRGQGLEEVEGPYVESAAGRPGVDRLSECDAQGKAPRLLWCMDMWLHWSLHGLLEVC